MQSVTWAAPLSQLAQAQPAQRQTTLRVDFASPNKLTSNPNHKIGSNGFQQKFQAIYGAMGGPLVVPTTETRASNDLLVDLKYSMDALGLTEDARTISMAKNALDATAFVLELIQKSGKQEDEVLAALGLAGLKGKALKYQVEKAKAGEGLDPADSTCKGLEIKVDGSGVYIQDNSDVQALDAGQPLSALIREQLILAKQTPFAYRDHMSEYVQRLFAPELAKDKYFTSTRINDQELSDLLDSIEKHAEFLFEGDIDLDTLMNLIVNGIGANEMYMHQFAKFINELANVLNINFHMEALDNPADLVRVLRNAIDPTTNNTMAYDMSRSGGTTEPADFFEMTCKDEAGLRINKRVVWANKGRFHALGEKLAQDDPNAQVLHIENTPGNIGGRHMNLSTDMVYGPMFTAFAIMGYKLFNGNKTGAKKWATDQLRTYVRALWEQNMQLSPKQDVADDALIAQASTNASTQLSVETLKKRDVDKRIKIPMIFDPGLKDLATEHFQNGNEGWAKPAKGKERNNNMLSFWDAGQRDVLDYMEVIKARPELYQPVFIMDQNVPLAETMRAQIDELKALGVPVKVIALDLKHNQDDDDFTTILNNFSYNLAVLARATATLQTWVTTFTHLTDQDANSNPAVKTTREATAAIQDILVERQRAKGSPLTADEKRVTLAEIAEKMQETKARNKELAEQDLAQSLAQAETGRAEALPPAFLEFIENTLQPLADALGISVDKALEIYVSSMSHQVFAADFAESGGQASTRIDVVLGKTAFGETLGTSTDDFSLPPLSNEVVAYEDKNMTISFACPEDLSAEQQESYTGDESTAAKIATYYMDRMQEEDRLATVNTLGVGFMDADKSDGNIIDTMAAVNKNLSKFGINSLPMNFPRIAHTGIEAAQALPEIMLLLGLIPMQTFPEMPGNLGSVVIRDGLTVNDANQIYSLSNLARMALGGSPVVFVKYKNSEQLPEISKMATEAMKQLSEALASNQKVLASNANVKQSTAKEGLMMLRAIHAQHPSTEWISTKDLLPGGKYNNTNYRTETVGRGLTYAELRSLAVLGIITWDKRAGQVRLNETYHADSLSDIQIDQMDIALQGLYAADESDIAPTLNQRGLDKLSMDQRLRLTQALSLTEMETLEESDIIVDGHRNYDFRFMGRFLKRALAFCYGMVIGSIALINNHGNPQRNTFIVGRDSRNIKNDYENQDPREPSDIKKGIISALMFLGINVVDICPEQADGSLNPNTVTSYNVAFLKYQHQLLGSILLTCSHVSEPKMKDIGTDEAPNKVRWYTSGFKVKMLGKEGYLRSMKTTEIKGMVLDAIKDLVKRKEARVKENLQEVNPQKKQGTYETDDTINQLTVDFGTMVGRLAAADGSLYELDKLIRGGKMSLEDIIALQNEKFPETDILRGQTIVVDGSGTPAGKIIKQIFENLGATVILINGEIQDYDDEHQADPGNAENMVDLHAAVKEHKAHFGCKVDLDGDRLAIEVFLGEDFLALGMDNLLISLAPDMIEQYGYGDVCKKEDKKIAIVVDALSNLAAEDMAAEMREKGYNVEVFRADAGYPNVEKEVSRLEDEGYIVMQWGEKSGHGWMRFTGLVENPTIYGILFAIKVAKEQFKNGVAQTARPYEATYEQATKNYPYVPSMRTQQIIFPEELNRVAQKYGINFTYSPQAAIPIKLVEFCRHEAIETALQYFVPGQTSFMAKGNTYTVSEIVGGRDSRAEDNLNRFVQIKFEDQNGNLVGAFVLRGSSNDPTYVSVDVAAVFVNADETKNSPAVKDRESMLSGILNDFLVTNRLADVNLEVNITKISKKSGEEHAHRLPKYLVENQSRSIANMITERFAGQVDVTPGQVHTAMQSLVDNNTAQINLSNSAGITLTPYSKYESVEEAHAFDSPWIIEVKVNSSAGETVWFIKVNNQYPASLLKKFGGKVHAQDALAWYRAQNPVIKDAGRVNKDAVSLHEAEPQRQDPGAIIIEDDITCPLPHVVRNNAWRAAQLIDQTVQQRLGATVGAPMQTHFTVLDLMEDSYPSLDLSDGDETRTLHLTGMTEDTVRVAANIGDEMTQFTIKMKSNTVKLSSNAGLKKFALDHLDDTSVEAKYVFKVIQAIVDDNPNILRNTFAQVNVQTRSRLIDAIDDIPGYKLSAPRLWDLAGGVGMAETYTETIKLILAQVTASTLTQASTSDLDGDRFVKVQDLPLTADADSEDKLPVTGSLGNVLGEVPVAVNTAQDRASRAAQRLKQVAMQYRNEMFVNYQLVQTISQMRGDTTTAWERLAEIAQPGDLFAIAQGFENMVTSRATTGPEISDTEFAAAAYAMNFLSSVYGEGAFNVHDEGGSAIVGEGEETMVAFMVSGADVLAHSDAYKVLFTQILDKNEGVLIVAANAQEQQDVDDLLEDVLPQITCPLVIVHEDQEGLRDLNFQSVMDEFGQGVLELRDRHGMNARVMKVTDFINKYPKEAKTLL